MDKTRIRVEEPLEVIHSYTREQAIEDGMLVNMSHTSEVREAGFKVPVCVTRPLWDKINYDEDGQDSSGRFWDICFLAAAAFKCKKANGEDCHLVSFTVQFSEDSAPTVLWLVFHEAEGFTIMFPDDY